MVLGMVVGGHLTLLWVTASSRASLHGHPGPMGT